MTRHLDLNLIFTQSGPNLQQLEHMLQAIDDDTTSLNLSSIDLDGAGEHAPAIFQAISKLPLTSLFFLAITLATLENMPLLHS